MSIEERVARLERQNRRLKQGLAVVVLVVTGAVIMGATRQTRFGETVEAQAFVVKDKSGKIRATFAVQGEEAGLDLYDKDGKRRVALGVTKDGEPGLYLYDKDGKRRVGLGMTGGDESSLQFFDTSEKLRAWLSVSKDGEPGLVLKDLNGRGRIALKVLKGNLAVIALADALGKIKWSETAK